jgi:hypothetical protein
MPTLPFEDTNKALAPLELATLRRSLLPLPWMVSDWAGVVVPIPTLLPNWKMLELVRAKVEVAKGI